MRKLKIKKSAKVAIYIVYLLILLLILPEFCLRAMGFYGESDKTEFIRHDKTLGWALVPNKNVVDSGIEWKVSYKINEDGFREKPDIKEDKKGTFRVLLLGDSFTEGYGIGQDKRFSDLVQRRFKKRRKNVEIINTGVRGYNLSQYYLLYQSLCAKYNPDLVIICAVSGDLDVVVKDAILDNGVVYGRPYYSLDNQKLTLKGVPVLVSDKHELYKNDKLEGFKKYLRKSALYTFIRAVSDNNIFLRNIGVFLRLKKDTFADSGYGKTMSRVYNPMHDPMLYNKEKNEKVSLAIISDMFYSLKKKNKDFIIFLLTDDIFDTNESYYTKLSGNLGCLYINFPKSSIEYTKNTRKYHFKIDPHFNEKGNALVSEVLYDFLNTKVLKNEKD